MAMKKADATHMANLKRGSISKPKSYTVTEADKKKARAEMAKAKKNTKRGKDVPCD